MIACCWLLVAGGAISEWLRWLVRRLWEAALIRPHLSRVTCLRLTPRHASPSAHFQKHVHSFKDMLPLGHGKGFGPIFFWEIRSIPRENVHIPTSP
jgi:hypothetical protein